MDDKRILDERSSNDTAQLILLILCFTSHNSYCHMETGPWFKLYALNTYYHMSYLIHFILMNVYRQSLFVFH